MDFHKHKNAECPFGKFNKGGNTEKACGLWVLGEVDRETEQCFLVPCPGNTREPEQCFLVPCPGNSRGADVLLPITERWVLPGSIVYSIQRWVGACNNFHARGYTHDITNTQEGLWYHVKRQMVVSPPQLSLHSSPPQLLLHNHIPQQSSSAEDPLLSKFNSNILDLFEIDDDPFSLLSTLSILTSPDQRPTPLDPVPPSADLRSSSADLDKSPITSDLEPVVPGRCEPQTPIKSATALLRWWSQMRASSPTSLREDAKGAEQALQVDARQFPLRGVRGLKVWEHDFEITSGPKGPQHGPTFWLGFEAPDP